jgi:hypothetical protein
MSKNYTDLSRIASHALRHEPWLYELELDHEGWTSIVALLDGIRHDSPVWADITEADLTEDDSAFFQATARDRGWQNKRPGRTPHSRETLEDAWRTSAPSVSRNRSRSGRQDPA